MRILVVTPTVPRARTGNRVTALRWVRMLRGLGHGVMVVSEYGGQPCDVLVALHARKSALPCSVSVTSIPTDPSC